MVQFARKTPFLGYWTDFFNALILPILKKYFFSLKKIIKP